MQVEFGDQRFTNSNCLPFLHFLIHLRVVVMKTGGERELSLLKKEKGPGSPHKINLFQKYLLSKHLTAN